MPSAAKTRLCAFGDSHLASLKSALNKELVDVSGADIEFWGATGTLFREIHDVEGRMRPLSDECLKQVLMINGHERESLGPDDFDAYLFFGARLRTSSLFQAYLEYLDRDHAFVSEAALERMVAHWLQSCRGYRTARWFAEDGAARVFFAPAAFLNQGVAGAERRIAAMGTGLCGERVERLWRVIDRAMSNDGVELVRQPLETLANPCMTRAEFATENAAELDDWVHKNAQYGAIIWKEVLGRLAQNTQSAKAAAE